MSQQDGERARYISTTADVAEGLLTFGELEVCGRKYLRSDGVEAEALCFVCKDLQGTRHAISASSFLERSPIYVRDPKTWSWTPVLCKNCGPDTMPYVDLWEQVLSKKKVTLHRIVGRRGNSREKAFEYFTVED